MGLASALNTALTGLNAAETTIDVVGNNLANSNTVGFKASQASFATQFLRTQSLGSAPTENSTGGTNPRQLGLGTMVADITPNFNQGTIQISSSPTDMAIQGDGFFIVRGNTGELLYTRNGIFKMNADNELVSLTGNRVMGFGASDEYEIDEASGLVPIKIPLGSAAVAQATRNVFLEGTLSPTGTIATKGQIIETEMLSDKLYPRPTNLTTTGAISSTYPTSDLAEVAAGGTMDAGDKYLYRLVNVDPITDTESMFETLDVEIAADDSHVHFSNREAAAGQLRRLYRTDNTGVLSTLKLLKTFDGSGEDLLTVWDDTGAAAAGAPMDTRTIKGDYAYYVTFYDRFDNESLPSLPISPSAMGEDGRIQLQDIPKDDSGYWDGGRKIYRGTKGSDTFLEVAAIDGDTDHILTFTDNIPDADLDPTKVLDFYGPRINNTTTLAVNVLRRSGDDYVSVFSEGTLTFAGRKGGRSLEAKEMTITDTTTLREVVGFMSDVMGIQSPPGPDTDNPIPADASLSNPGGDVTTDGKIRFVGNAGAENAIEIDLGSLTLAATGAAVPVNLSFNTRQEAEGESAVTDFVAYDSLGQAIPVRLTAVLQSRDSTGAVYRWFADSPDNVSPASDDKIAVGTGLITFDNKGNYFSSTTDQIQISRDGATSAESPLTFSLDFTAISGLASDQSSLAVSRQDGSSKGVLTSFIVGGDGTIRGVFSNGVTRDIGQVRLVRFSNPSGLQQKGQNLYASGVNSGEPVQGSPGEQGIGEIIPGAQELSNTDIGSNLIDLILASTMYRGNTRVITTVQQMLDELLALRR